MIDKNNFGFFNRDEDKHIATFPYCGYVSPTFGSTFLSDERQFNLMFRSQIGPVDVLGDISVFVNNNKDLNSEDLREGIEDIIKKSAV